MTIEPWKVPLWDAINAVVAASTGTKGQRIAGGVARMKAVVLVETAVEEAIAAAAAAASEASVRRLQNLLARVHRDGGQHTDEVGLEQSCADADRIITEREARLEAVERDLTDLTHRMYCLSGAPKPDHPTPADVYAAVLNRILLLRAEHQQRSDGKAESEAIEQGTAMTDTDLLRVFVAASVLATQNETKQKAAHAGLRAVGDAVAAAERMECASRLVLEAERHRTASIAAAQADDAQARAAHVASAQALTEAAARLRRNSKVDEAPGEITETDMLRARLALAEKSLTGVIDALFDEQPHDVEHTIECHSDTVNDSYRRLAAAAEVAMESAQVWAREQFPVVEQDGPGSTPIMVPSADALHAQIQQALAVLCDCGAEPGAIHGAVCLRRAGLVDGIKHLAERFRASVEPR